MSANAELSVQIANVGTALRALSLAVDTLGGGAATYAVVDAGDRKIILEMMREIESLGTALEDMASTASERH